MLIRQDLFGEIDLEDLAIRRLQEFEPQEGYYFANSYSKDSGVVRHLMQKAGVLDRATCKGPFHAFWYHVISPYAILLSTALCTSNSRPATSD